MKIGEKIKELRRENNLTQEQLADYLCVSYQAVSKWETGISNPDLSLIEPLTKLFRVSSDELLGLNETETDKRSIELEEAAMLRKMILKCYKETCNHLHIYDSLDSELLSTIQCFFENNLRSCIQRKKGNYFASLLKRVCKWEIITNASAESVEIS